LLVGVQGSRYIAGAGIQIGDATGPLLLVSDQVQKRARRFSTHSAS
jgi:hypothetical protein